MSNTVRVNLPLHVHSDRWLELFSQCHRTDRSTRTGVGNFSLFPDRFHLIDNGSFKSNNGRLSPHHGNERWPFTYVRDNHDALLFFRSEAEV